MKIWPLITLLGVGALNAAKYPTLILKETSGKSQTNIPVTIGQAFPLGTKFTHVSVTAGSKTYPTQVDVKRTYPDGSIKHAMLSFVLPQLGANENLSLSLTEDAAPTGAPIVIAAADVPDLSAQFTLNGVVKQVSLKSLIGSTTSPRLWLQGPVVTEAVYEAAPTTVAGLLPDPSLYVQFHVRVYKPSNISRVSVIVDNTWKSYEGDVKYAVKVLSGGTTLYQNDTVTHFAYSRWKKDFFFGGGVPDGLQIVYDVPYLISTGLIPRYHMGIKVDPKSIQDSWSNWNKSNHDILGSGNITPYFPTTGGREDIGLNPGWVIRYLLSMDSQARTMAFNTADLAGSFPMHIRDSKDKFVLSVEDYPTVTLIAASAQWSNAADKLPAVVGTATSPYTVDCAHMPSPVYIPYLLSGDLYYLQEQYQWSNYCLVSSNFQYRSGALGLVNSDQVRGQAWSLRNIADAAAIAPDVDREKGYFDRILKNNIQYYDTAVVAFSPLGSWGQQSNVGSDGGRPDDNMSATVRNYTSPWMIDFLSLVFDHIVDLGYSQAKPIRNHLLKNAIGRITGAGYNPYDGPTYHIAVNDVSGKAYTDWATVWQNSFAKRTTPAPTALEEGDCTHGYPYILRATLTAAARDSLPMGREAYNFMEAHLTRACFASVQSWALVPNASDVPMVGSSAIRSDAKKKTPSRLVSVVRRDGAFELNLAESDGGTIQWKITNVKGEVLQTALGKVCRVPDVSGTGSVIRYYHVESDLSESSGMVVLPGE